MPLITFTHTCTLIPFRLFRCHSFFLSYCSFFRFFSPSLFSKFIRNILLWLFTAHRYSKLVFFFRKEYSLISLFFTNLTEPAESHDQFCTKILIKCKENQLTNLRIKNNELEISRTSTKYYSESMFFFFVQNTHWWVCPMNLHDVFFFIIIIPFSVWNEQSNETIFSQW